MAYHSPRIERRNTPRSPYLNNQGIDFKTGKKAYKFNLVLQNGVLVDRTNPYSINDPVVYTGPIFEPANYGKIIPHKTPNT